MTSNELKRTLITLAAGAAAGGAAALLFAPMKGEELRGKIADEAHARKDQAGEKMNELAGRARDKAREITEDAGHRIKQTRVRAEKVVARGRDGAVDHGHALSAAVHAGIEAYEQSLNGRG